MTPVIIVPSQVLLILAGLALIAGLGNRGRIGCAATLFLLSIATSLVEWLS